MPVCSILSQPIPGKSGEATEYLDDDVQQFDFDYPEVQADDLRTVAAKGARAAYRAADGPVIVDDAGLSSTPSMGSPARTPRTSRTLSAWNASGA